MGMASCSYMCGGCFQVCDNINIFNHHTCHTNLATPGNMALSHNDVSIVCKGEDSDTGNDMVVLRVNELAATEEGQFSSSELITHREKQQGTIEMTQQNENSNITLSQENMIILQNRQKMQESINMVQDTFSQDEVENSEMLMNPIEEEEKGFNIKNQFDEDEEEKDATGTEEMMKTRRRKKYQVREESYRLNRTMRDKDFKLGRSNYYSFKDTLGDWDNCSTLLLLHLINRYPHTHFLVPSKTEKRLGHWEAVHREMEAAGYNFTVLQLRMRWREVLQKYRWTVDYNDQHEVKKTCEYFDEMNELFGDWDRDATKALMNQIKLIKAENQGKKIIRIGYGGWEKITDNLCDEGHKFSINKVEARWRNLVTLYKTTVDHNDMPNVEPRSIAYLAELEALICYKPQRRQNYEKKKGRSVVMERFPTSGSRVLLQAYKDFISSFVDPNIDNKTVWDSIRQRLESEGHKYSAAKLKEVLTGMIKGYEKCQHHNSLPGAIRRYVPFFRELSEIFEVHDRWPHLHTKRTNAMKTTRKFKLRLLVSQQLWTTDESRALLEVYPRVLESHASSHGHAAQPSHLWLQLAKAYAETSYPRRDVPEIAIHIGLLRQGYTQNNNFPFIEEMRRVKEAEEAVCYSPDVSKFTGDVEVTYWSHTAVERLLDLYLHHQAATATNLPHVPRSHVFTSILQDMHQEGYGYTEDEIREQFQSLLTKYNTRQTKPWDPPPTGRQSNNPVAAPYMDRLDRVFELRRSLSLSWTTGVKPLSESHQTVVLNIAKQLAEEVLGPTPKHTGTARMSPAVEKGKGQWAGEGDDQRAITKLVEEVVTHIRTNNLINPVPRTRQVRLHLAEMLRNAEDTEAPGDVDSLHYILYSHGLLEAVCHVPLEPTNYNYNSSDSQEPKKKRKCVASVRIPGKQRRQSEELNRSVSRDDDCTNTDQGWVSEEEDQEMKSNKESQEECIDEACDYLTLALSYLKRDFDEGECSVKELKNTSKERVPVLKASRKSQDIIIENKAELDSYNHPNTSMQDSSNEIYNKDLFPQKANRVGNLKVCPGNMKDSSTDIYKDLFPHIQKAKFESCSKESKGDLYVFSSMNSSLCMHLPSEFNIAKSRTKHSTQRKANINRHFSKSCDGLSEQYDEIPDAKITKGRTKNTQSRKTNKIRYSSKSHDSSSELDDDDDDEMPDVNSGISDEDTDLADIKVETQTRLIQTRSGRKTRFTFFSHSLANDSEENTGLKEEDTSLISNPLKKIKPEPEEQIASKPKKKRGRSKKTDKDNLELLDITDRLSPTKGSPITCPPPSSKLGQNSCPPPSLIPQSSDNNNTKVGDIEVQNRDTDTDPLVTFMKEHQAWRRKKQEETVSVIKQQSSEQTILLSELLEMVQKMREKMK